jgi:hypothetical protein
MFPLRNHNILCVPAGWADGGMGLRVGFININDMYNNDVMSVRGEHRVVKLLK